MPLEELWQTALGKIELEISPAIFATWFKNSQLIAKDEGGAATIACHNNFTREWLENRHRKLILKTLRNLDSDIRSVAFIIHNEAQSLPKKRPEPKLIVNLDQQMHLEDFQVDPETNLNPKYVTKNFIVGSGNELAHAAATAVVETLGTKYNPLFIYGGVGLGKTHLLHAIGNAVRERYGQKKKVRYVTSEKFTEELVSSIRKQTIDEFKNRFRQLDLLLIDDIQFVAGKEKTQEELFHVFNTLYERSRQIVFSSDRTPKQIPALEERLRSRFEGGMIADIGYPDFETRVAILKAKLAYGNFSLGDDTLQFIASKIQKNIRELEGALNRVMAYYKIKNREPALAELDALLGEILSTPAKVITAKQIIRAVSEFYDIEEKNFSEKSRKKDVVKPRQIAMYLLREELKTSYPAIGEKFGGRDHTTVIHACEKIEREIGEGGQLAKEINLLREKIMTS